MLPRSVRLARQNQGDLLEWALGPIPLWSRAG